MTKTLLYLPCCHCHTWLVAGKGAAKEAEDEVSLENAASDAGWEVGSRRNWCPGCAEKEKVERHRATGAP